MNTTQQTAETLNGRGQGGPEFKRAVRDYVRAYVWRHGRPKTAEDLGVSRHTLWRFLERGHMGLAVPSAVLNSAGGSVRAIESARQQLIIDLMGLRPDPALRPLREGLEEALLLLCATPLSTVDELSRLGRVPASTLRERLEKLAKRGLVNSAPHHLSVLGPRPLRRYFPTEKGVIAGGVATKGEAHMLRAYPVSKQWVRLLAERLDAVAVLYRIAATVADSDPHNDPMRVDHYRKGPYDMLLTLSGGRSIGLLRQGPTLSTSNLRYRIRSIERLHNAERPFVTLVLTHADQATRRAIRSQGDPSEHGRTFAATEGELLAGDHNGVVWQQCGSGLGDEPPVRVSPDASLPGILVWAERLLDSSYSFLRDIPKPSPGALYSSGVQASMPEPSQQLVPALSVQLTRADKEALDLLAAWPLCTREQLAGLMGGVTLRRVNQVLRSLSQHGLVRADSPLHMLTDEGLTYLARRDRAAVGLTLDRWSAEPSYSNPDVYAGTALRTLASQLRHHAGVTGFAAALSTEVARSPHHDLFDLLPFQSLPVGDVPAWLLGPLWRSSPTFMPLPPSRLQFGAELMRQDLIVDTPHTAHPDRFSGSAPSYYRPAQGLDGPVLWGLGSMLHPCTKAVPRVSYRGHKGILCTYRVSPQQAETGHLLQRSEPADPGGGSSLCRLKIGWPVVYSKTAYYTGRRKEQPCPQSREAPTPSPSPCHQRWPKICGRWSRRRTAP